MNERVVTYILHLMSQEVPAGKAITHAQQRYGVNREQIRSLLAQEGVWIDDALEAASDA